MVSYTQIENHWGKFKLRIMKIYKNKISENNFSPLIYNLIVNWESIQLKQSFTHKLVKENKKKRMIIKKKMKIFWWHQKSKHWG
jgi:hypothetical protein